MKIATFLVLVLIATSFSVYAEEGTVTFDEPYAVPESKPGKWNGWLMLGETGLGALAGIGAWFTLTSTLDDEDEGKIYGGAAGCALGSSLGVIAAGEWLGKPTRNKSTTFLVTAGVSLIYPMTMAVIYDLNRTPGTPSCDDEVIWILLIGVIGSLVVNPIINMITYNLLKEE